MVNSNAKTLDCSPCRSCVQKKVSFCLQLINLISSLGCILLLFLSDPFRVQMIHPKIQMFIYAHSTIYLLHVLLFSLLCLSEGYLWKCTSMWYMKYLQIQNTKYSRIQILKKPSKRNWIIVIPGNKYGIDEIPLKLRRYSNTMSVQQ